MAVTKYTDKRSPKSSRTQPSIGAKNKAYRQSSAAPAPKSVNATARALRSKSTNPAAAARSRAVVGEKGVLTAAQFRRSEAKSKVRKVTRRAVRKGFPAGESKGGLGITKDEGSKGLQKAVKTLGYKGAKKLVKKVAAKRG